MLKTKVGYSENVDAFASGAETAKMANVIENPQVGLLFTSCVQDQNKIMEGAKSVLGDVPVIGCTSSAAICTQDGYLNKETGYSGMMLFGGDLEVVTAGSAQTDETPREVGRKVALEAISKVKGEDTEPDFFFMSASPANEEEYLEGIQDVIGNVPVFGGSAADNTVEGKWSILNDGEAFADGLTIAIFYTKGEMKNLYTGAYHETNNVGVITKVRDERTLVEIDHEPALKKYAEWTGKTVESLMGNNLLTETICAPLGVKDPIGKVTAVRHPMAGNPDYSMNIGADLAVNTAVKYYNADNLRDQEIWEVALKGEVAKDLTLRGSWFYGDSDGYDGVADRLNESTDNNGWLVGLTYKGAKASKPGSWGLYANYSDRPFSTYLEPTVFSGGYAEYPDGLGAFTTDGYKGFEVGANVTLAKNIVAGVKYADFEGREDKGKGTPDAQVLWSEVVFTF